MSKKARDFKKQVRRMKVFAKKLVKDWPESELVFGKPEISKLNTPKTLFAGKVFIDFNPLLLPKLNELTLKGIIE